MIRGEGGTLFHLMRNRPCCIIPQIGLCLALVLWLLREAGGMQKRVQRERRMWESLAAPGRHVGLRRPSGQTSAHESRGQPYRSYWRRTSLIASYFIAALTPLDAPTFSFRKSSQVRLPTARPRARLAPARSASAALPGSLTCMISRCLWVACR